MSIFDIFSKRQKRLRGEMPDIYQYEMIPQPLRVQIVHILRDAIGELSDETYHYHQQIRESYQTAVQILCREYGVFRLGSTPAHADKDYPNQLLNFLLQTEHTEQVLDVIEIGFRLIDRIVRANGYLGRHNADRFATNAIEELNARLKEHGVGYQFIDGEVVRIDSELIHAEAVKPALRLLNTKSYKGAHEEFLKAYEHYRHGNIKEALNECLKAYESTMKSICDKRRWSYSPNDTASKLIGVLYDNGLVPQFWQGQLTSLRSLLESSIPTGRNRMSGHGQGSTPTDVPAHFAAYMLHMTASTLVFLTTAEEAMPK
ncbi:STM4504/CBY_0614 family protein [Mesorhizobium salmacidum]|uniref:Abortive infection protein-like C-terminal domain-containing protein n=1 Tax=Mesorhizobium salmacidum TaxID=3015171 RepID=A0ABU8KW16_9HYPH